MELRFCPRCRADVEDAGGFCLLGHRFPVATGDPIADLRAEVDQAFAKVQVEVASVLAHEGTPPTPAPSAASAEDVPIWQQLKGDDHEVVEDMRVTSKKVYEELAADAPVSQSDPIIAFSPSPRADWGPEKGHGKRSRR